MPHTDVNLCATALVKLGARPIASFDEPTAEAETAARLYPVVRDATLMAHPWSFTLAQAALLRLPDQPAGDFAFAFALPPDILRTISAGTAGTGRGLVYRVFGGRLHADSDTVLLTYQRRPAESEFPAYFEYIHEGESLPPPVPLDLQVGWMIYDVFDLSSPGHCESQPSVSLFWASVRQGVMAVPPYESEEVKKPGRR
jgi:hypothetical protein